MGNVFSFLSGTLPAEECQAISRAFDLGDNVRISNFTNACLQDAAMINHGSGINARLDCSTESDCPQTHRTNMDQQDIACNNGIDAAIRSICPCEPLPAAIPAFNQWGLIALAVILGIVGFMVVRRKATA